MDPHLEALLTRFPWWALAFECLFLAAAAALVFFCLRQKRQSRGQWNQVQSLQWPTLSWPQVLILWAVTYLLLAQEQLPWALLFFTLFVLHATKIDWRKRLGLDRFSARKFLALWLWLMPAMIGLLLPLMLVITLVWKFWHLPYTPQLAVDHLLSMKDPGQLIYLFCMAIVIAPAIEELFFRGFLYPLSKNKYGWLAAFIGVNLFFGFIHWDLPTFLPLVALGMFWTAVYERTGSLILCMALHASFNALTCGLILLIRWLGLNLA